ncbi:MAG: undecaprenyldiphospho-muramoylpentapeptide beta-N-acetylglucosaminyltransferase [Actinomycetota bacterium]
MAKISKKVLICGGGTAGHIYPAVALIEYIKDFYPGYQVLFLGTDRGMENKFIPQLEVEFKKIRASGLGKSENLGQRIIIYIKFLFNLIVGLVSSVKILIGYRPDAILGMGGYVCAPLLLAAILTRRSFSLHEQNYIPGRLNKFFSKFAQNIFISFSETRNYFKNTNAKIIYSGNPIRKVIKNFNQKNIDYRKWGLRKGRFTIVAFGGSLGADKINKIIIDLYKYFRNRENIQILLLTGSRFFRKMENTKKELIRDNDKLIFSILPYVEEMDEIYNMADLIISRAGANTVAELIKTNVPAILIPFPYAIGNHQYYNAKFLAENGSAIVLLDRDLNSRHLIDNIEGLIKNDMGNYKKFRERKNNLKNIENEKIIIDNL